ncbi:hypothetical protein VTI74DRAFT_2539 [Chaetomium olivicolor]
MWQIVTFFSGPSYWICIVSMASGTDSSSANCFSFSGEETRPLGVPAAIAFVASSHFLGQPSLPASSSVGWGGSLDLSSARSRDDISLPWYIRN